MIKIFDFKSDRLHGLDHLRALAIVLVMTHHYRLGLSTWLEPIRNIGWTGVDLFFVLSGYLIGYQLLTEMKNTNTISFKRFYLKRFFRIIPAYIVVLIVYYSLGDYKEASGMPPSSATFSPRRSNTLEVRMPRHSVSRKRVSRLQRCESVPITRSREAAALNTMFKSFGGLFTPATPAAFSRYACRRSERASLFRGRTN